jgi:hypothetical protein
MEANPKGAFRQEKEAGRLGRRAACVFDPLLSLSI